MDVSAQIPGQPRVKVAPWKRVAGAAAAGVAVALAGYFVGGAIPRPDGVAPRTGLDLDPLEKVGLVAAVVSAAVVALLAHEVGHLLGGRLAGFRALLLIVGPLRLERGVTRWHWRLNRNLALAGGLAASVPAAPADTATLRRRTLIMVAGGPVTSLVAAIAALGAWWAVTPWPLVPATSFQVLLTSIGLLAFGACSAVICAATLVPAQTAGYQTDGAQIGLLLRGGPIADRAVATHAVFGASMSGVRPRDWPVELLERARAVHDGSSTEVVAWQMAQMHAADGGQRDDARRWLGLVLDHIDRLPEAARPAVRYDAARQLALRGEVAQARALVSMGGRSLGAPFLAPLAELAILVADGRHDDARRLLPGARAMIADGIDPGGAAWLRDELAALADAIDAHGGRPAPPA